MANSEETLEQVVNRIATKLFDENAACCCTECRASDVPAYEAAIRQGIAWAYRDASRRIRAATIGSEAEMMAKVLEHRAEEAGRG